MWRALRLVPAPLSVGCSVLSSLERHAGGVSVGGDVVCRVRCFHSVSDRPEFEWVKSFPLGHSITDLEVQYGFLRKRFTPVHGTVTTHMSVGPTITSWGWMYLTLQRSHTSATRRLSLRSATRTSAASLCSTTPTTPLAWHAATSFARTCSRTSIASACPYRHVCVFCAAVSSRQYRLRPMTWLNCVGATTLSRCRRYTCHYGGKDKEGKPVTSGLQV